MKVPLPNGLTVEVTLRDSTFRRPPAIAEIRCRHWLYWALAYEIRLIYAAIPRTCWKRGGGCYSHGPNDLLPIPTDDLRGRFMRQLMPCWPYPSGFT